MKQFLLFLFSASCLSVAGWLRADTYTWDAGTGFAWQIGADTDTVWDPDGLPGPDDTIAFDWHRTASISLSSDMEVGGISFLTSSNLTLQAGGTPYYFRSLRSVSTADHDAVRTNTVMYAYTPDGATFQAHAGRNVVLAIHRLQAAHADGNFSLVKTGAGILLFGNNDQTSLQTTNTITVLEGELRMESYAATDNKAATIVIGGGANPATLRVTRTAGDAKPGAHPYSRVYVKPNGRYHFPVKASPVQFWNKFFEVEGGLLDLSGNMLTLRNWDGDTWDYELRLIGGTVTNGVYTFSWLSNTHPVLKALAADTPSVFHADLSMSSRSPLLIERGPAPVGLVLHGQILNRSFIKEGDGVLQLAAPEGNPYYQANSPTLLNAGTILANNAAGWAFGTNGVTMAAGTTLGGTGRVYAGRLNHPITIADGTPEAPTTLSGGSLDAETGARIPGTLSFLGDESGCQTVSLGADTRIRTFVSELGDVGALHFDGGLTLDAGTELTIDADEVHTPGGEYTLLSFGTLTGRFGTVTLNGEIPIGGRFAIRYRDAEGAAVTGTDPISGGSVLLRVFPQETLLLIR